MPESLRKRSSTMQNAWLRPRGRRTTGKYECVEARASITKDDNASEENKLGSPRNAGIRFNGDVRVSQRHVADAIGKIRLMWFN